MYRCKESITLVCNKSRYMPWAGCWNRIVIVYQQCLMVLHGDVKAALLVICWVTDRFPSQSQLYGALIFSMLFVWWCCSINRWVVGVLRRYNALVTSLQWHFLHKINHYGIQPMWRVTAVRSTSMWISIHQKKNISKCHLRMAVLYTKGYSFLFGHHRFMIPALTLWVSYKYGTTV